MAAKLIGLADPMLIPIVRSGDEPIGFGIALPDYNQVLIHLNGRITPLSALKIHVVQAQDKKVRECSRCLSFPNSETKACPMPCTIMHSQMD